MSGKEIRLAKLFSRGKAIVVALDHGAYMGPLQGIENLPLEIGLYKKADAILLNPNMARYCGKFFASHNSPLCIIRINWASHYCPGFKEGYDKRLITVRQAVALGADMVITSLLIGGKEEANAENVGLLGEMFEESESLGIPLISEFIPMGGVDRFEGDENLVKLGVRMCAEIGCDLIKTVYIKDFANLTNSVSVPLLALGGAKMESEPKALDLARTAIEEGAAGLVFGRNVFQAKNPEKFLDDLIGAVRRSGQ